ncbi:unnamed protein product [Caenorhabditis angaria]|uniref:Uncharacterized protein n=1 Tax=Caenorhabditis angaria TaxID=860376 RepID=A0A9P1MTJ2_9PELO|nr:unnamed protein product [Caenorhabditis angaria]
MLLVYWIFEIITFVDLGNRTFAEGNADKPGFHDMLLKTVHNTATYFGFGKKCKNHGKLLEDNSCLCPKFFSG